ncbi:MAG: efflux RND transporter permease subunit [Bacteroidales bacterium]|nr:efflux RND transporter permease subunit [Bacteroidales bacterium]
MKTLIDFLIRRPVGLVTTFLALIILGIISYTNMSTSLLPVLDIPTISVRISAPTYAATALEKMATTPLRQQLGQLSHLKDIESTTQDGKSEITITVGHEADIDLVMLEVNEYIDAAMQYIPNDITRPYAIRRSETELPVFTLAINVKEGITSVDFKQLSDLVEGAIRRRIEQIPEVSLADISGTTSTRISVSLRENADKATGLSTRDIANIIKQYNTNPTSVTIAHRQQRYTLTIDSRLHSANDLRNILFWNKGKQVRLGEICDIHEEEVPRQGSISMNGKRSVCINILKRNNANMSTLENKMCDLISEFNTSYPALNIELLKDQTKLLNDTISSLLNNLLLGTILIFIATLLFVSKRATGQRGACGVSLAIVITMTVSIIVMMIPMYLLGRTINIISLTGMIMAIGMMIDNSIIVSENIRVKSISGMTSIDACVMGASEMATPLLSSMLTTIIIFMPLLFLSGDASAIFTDQAITISIGLIVSYCIALTFLPGLSKYLNVYKRTKNVDTETNTLNKWYDKWHGIIFKRPVLSLGSMLLVVLLGIISYIFISKGEMPTIDHTSARIRIAWSEESTLAQNENNITELVDFFKQYDAKILVHCGTQGYTVDDSRQFTAMDSEIYIESNSKEVLDSICCAIPEWSSHKNASYRILPPQTIFDKVFETDQPDLTVRITNTRKQNITTSEALNIEAVALRGCETIEHTSLQTQHRNTMLLDNQVMQLYGSDFHVIQDALTQATVGQTITELPTHTETLPVVLTREDIPSYSFARTRTEKQLRDITSSNQGQHVGITFQTLEVPESVIETIQSNLASHPTWNASFGGQYIDSHEMLLEMLKVVIVSILLMYFILCAQFQSFALPLIVLIELPIDIAAGLFALYCFGESLNLVSAIGLVVSCGIIVNDSILKIDAIETMRNKGESTKDAILEAGHQRLLPIVLTSITSIGTALPLLFTHDMGSQIQRPFAISLIATMVVGTMVSLFVVPLIYQLIIKEK